MRDILKSKSVWAWCFYDWANSAFALTVIAAFFPVFFKGYWNIDVDTAISTARLGLGNSISGVLIALLSPLLGAIAGAGNLKKRFLFFFIGLGATATICLYCVPAGFWLTALSIFILARIGFFLANLFYDAMLIDVSTVEQRDFVSSLGFAIGYLGCGLLFILNILMYSKPALFGFSSGAHAIRFSFLLVGVWWVLFSIPIFLYVKQSGQTMLPLRDSVRIGLQRLRSTAGEVLQIPSLLFFLFAYWLYIEGVNTVYMMATDYGLSIGLPLSTLMIALLIVQFVAFPSSIAFSFLAERIGARRTILVAIGVYIAITGAGGWLITTGRDFILFAAMTGAVQGTIQALSRSLFSRMVPQEKAADFFGIYNMIGRFAVILGPGLVGGINWICYKYGVSSITSARLGVSSIALLFVAGGLLLLQVKDMERR